MDGTEKNIVIIGPAHPLRPGGITTFNESLCKAIQEAGHQSKIISFSLQYPSFLFPGKSQFTNTAAPTDIVIESRINSINPFNWIKVGRYIKKLNPDIIIVRFWLPFMGPCLGTILRIAGNKKTKPVLAIADNVIPHEKRPGDKIFTQYFIGAVNRFVVMSRNVMQDLRLFTGKPCLYQAHPLYDNFGHAVSKDDAIAYLNKTYNTNLQPTDNILLFFGLIRAYKGLDILLEAIQKLPHKAAKLLIAGEWYMQKAELAHLLEHPEIASKIVLVDKFIPNDDVKYFFCSSTCVIQPYRSATQSGVTPVAYHFEIPMIVTNVGGLPEMVEHGEAGIVCEPEPIALHAAIEAYIGLGKNYFMPGLLASKQQLSWSTFVNRILDYKNYI